MLKKTSYQDLEQQIVELRKALQLERVQKTLSEKRLSSPEKLVEPPLAELDFLSQTAGEFYDLPPNQDIYVLIGNRLREIVGDAIVIVNSYDKKNKVFTAKSFLGLGKYTESIINLLKRNPAGMMVEMNDPEAMAVLLSGRFRKGPEGLYELSFKKIPKGICQTIETLLNVGIIYAIGFVYRKELLGDAIIITRKGENERLVKGRSRLIETFINYAAIALQRNLFEKALLRSEKKYHNLFKNGSDLLCVHDLEGNLLETNLAYKDNYGMRSEDLDGVNIRNFIPDKYRSEFDQYIKRIIECGEDDGYLRVINKSGDEVILEYRNKLLYDDENRPMAVHGAARDVTKQWKTQKELIENQKLLSEMASQVPGVLYQFYSRPNGKMGIYYVSEKSEEILGLKNDIDGYFEQFANLVLPEYRKDFIRSIEEAVKNISPWNYEGMLQKPTGEKIFFSGHSIPSVRDNEIVFNGIILDITDKKNAENEQKKLQRQLRQSQKLESIGTLAGGIAHDFNNILSSIIGFTELSLDDAPKGTFLEDNLQEVYLAGKRARDLVKQILAFARQSDEKIDPIQPSTIAKEVLKLIRSTIPTTIEIQQAIESEALIMGNATQVHQVLMNICTNAAHSMEDSGGVLSVSLKDLVLDTKGLSIGMKQGNYIEIKVSDTGVGIAPEIIQSIFDPYFTTKGPGEGTGMGLAMAQGVIEKYGGNITVDSEVGKGTTFTIYLPVTKKRSALSAYVEEQLPTGTERILFVDDEAPIAKMGSQILDRLGYSVTARTSSIEVLELFRSRPNDFDLVVTDMTMPNLTGDKLAVELMKIRRDIPIILCTGYSKKISDETALKIGIKAFAYKPIVKADLAKTVRKVLDESCGTFVRNVHKRH